VALDNDWHLYKIEYNLTNIKFYIDDILKTTHTTNLPTNLMKFYISILSNSTSTRSLNVDFIKITSDSE
jgi:hypothetical protein